MNRFFHKSAICFLLALLSLTFSVVALAQSDSDTWQRVYTGEDSIIELNTSTLQFDDKHILRLKIRTVLKEPEVLRDESRTKYKTRLETIEYNLRQKVYRLVQAVLLDATGKIVQTYDLGTADWKSIKAGGMMDRLLYGARRSLLFGNWKVVSYRLVDGDQNKRGGSLELDRLVGASVSFEAEHASVEQSRCSMPAYKSDWVSLEELSRRLGANVHLPVTKSDHIETISVKCDTDGWVPPQSLLIRLSQDRMMMLWQGVFLTLKRD